MNVSSSSPEHRNVADPAVDDMEEVDEDEEEQDGEPESEEDEDDDGVDAGAAGEKDLPPVTKKDEDEQVCCHANRCRADLSGSPTFCPRSMFSPNRLRAPDFSPRLK